MHAMWMCPFYYIQQQQYVRTTVEKNHHPATNYINLSSCYYLYNLQITTEVLNTKKLVQVPATKLCL